MRFADILKLEAEKRGIPLATLADVQKTIEEAKRTKVDKAMARALLNVGRITDEARAWVAREYPQCES